MHEEYQGIHRKKITWNPKIDYEKCINCRTCVEYLKLVYDVVEKREKKTIIGNPNNCIEFCTGCEGQCPVAGINLPSKKETRELIKKLEKN